MGGVRVDSVSVSAEFNACIVQTPSWGIFGNYRNHLEIGLPLAMVLTTDELKAVIAHEMGHLSQAHGKFGAWIYRQRVTWHALESKFSNPVGIFDQILGAFYGWYAPYFYAYSFVLARNHEYVADRAAANVTSAAAIGAALTKLELAGRFLSEVFWKRLYDQVERQPDPPYMPHAVDAASIQSSRAAVGAAGLVATKLEALRRRRRYASQSGRASGRARHRARDTRARSPAFGADAVSSSRRRSW